MSASRDHELDLMAAAVLGAAAGVALTLLFRRGPKGRSPMFSGMKAAKRGMHEARLASMEGFRLVGRKAAKNARRGMKRGRELMDEIPVEEFGEEIRDYLDAAKGAIEDTVRGELKDLRKAVRRRRRRIGL